jgi:drug/metabolite transporter (DMT)-like permease
MTRAQASLTGFGAVMLWSLLAVLTVRSAPVPPLLLNTLTFAIGGAVGMVWILATGSVQQLRGIGWRVYAFGTVGLFGYHFLYFSALRLAPAAEAGLICYLWPLLIVLFSGLMPGERLTFFHVAGALLSFIGTAILIAGNGLTLPQGSALTGFALALLAALTWALYSTLSRRLGRIPTASVAVFCLLTSALSGAFHLMLEPTVWPADAAGWASVAALGLGPVGLAFYVWDIGMKRGDIQLLGVASYAAPLLSTLVLVVAGVAAPSARLALAALLVTAGAALAAFSSARVRARSN